MPLQITNRLILQAAKKRGWASRIVDEEGGLIAVMLPNGTEVILKSSADPAAGIASYIIANRKEVFYRMGEERNLPVPVSMEITDANEAVSMLEEHKLLVVKPSDASHGNGVSLGIESIEELNKAVDLAREFSKSVLVQKQYEGNDYRVLVIGDEVVAATQRRPAFVVGDSVHTIAELIEIENSGDKRSDGYSEKMCKINTKAALNYLGDRSSEIPKKDEEITVLDIPNIGQGGASINVTHMVSDYIKSVATKAAKMVGLRIAGVDLLAPDLASNKPEEVVIIELNAIPSFGMHEIPNVGEPVQVSDLFLDEIVS